MRRIRPSRVHTPARSRPPAEWTPRDEAARLTGLTEGELVRLGKDGLIRWQNTWGHVRVSLSDARRVVAEGETT